VDIARSVGDPVLLSVALDAQGAAAENAGQLREAHRIGVERLATLLLIPDRAAEGRGELDVIGVRRPY